MHSFSHALVAVLVSGSLLAVLTKPKSRSTQIHFTGVLPRTGITASPKPPPSLQFNTVFSLSSSAPPRPVGRSCPDTCEWRPVYLPFDVLGCDERVVGIWSGVYCQISESGAVSSQCMTEDECPLPAPPSPPEPTCCDSVFTNHAGFSWGNRTDLRLVGPDHLLFEHGVNTEVSVIRGLVSSSNETSCQLFQEEEPFVCS